MSGILPQVTIGLDYADAFVRLCVMDEQGRTGRREDDREDRTAASSTNQLVHGESQARQPE